MPAKIVGQLLNHMLLSITGHRYARPSLDALRPDTEKTCSELTKRTSEVECCRHASRA